jgi:predicted  nucleic acid-binding Zn-ribbon protein
LLEKEKKRLTDEIKRSDTRVDSLKANTEQNLRYTTEALRKARETMTRLIHDTDRRVSD